MQSSNDPHDLKKHWREEVRILTVELEGSTEDVTGG